MPYIASAPIPKILDGCYSQRPIPIEFSILRLVEESKRRGAHTALEKSYEASQEPRRGFLGTSPKQLAPPEAFHEPR